jgi:hypothetical protein
MDTIKPLAVAAIAAVSFAVGVALGPAIWAGVAWSAGTAKAMRTEEASHRHFKNDKSWPPFRLRNVRLGPSGHILAYGDRRSSDGGLRQMFKFEINCSDKTLRLLAAGMSASEYDSSSTLYALDPPRFEGWEVYGNQELAASACSQTPNP